VLVSEGLAGHFSIELFGGEPEPWESLHSDTIQPYYPQMLENWHRTDYDHNAWFFEQEIAQVAVIYRRIQPDLEVSRIIPKLESFNAGEH
jgi:uncharacterized protein YjaZ